jgi:hypothetical protein
MVLSVRDANEADGRRASEGRVIVWRVYDVPCRTSVPALTVLFVDTYRQEAERDGAHEFSDADRARHGCDRMIANANKSSNLVDWNGRDEIALI